jgi:glycerophosphoryl diester phosphodiesterase
LELVAGRVPLLVEIKSNGRAPPKDFLETIARQATAYGGPVALMSFDASILKALGALAPAVPLGLVFGSHQLPATWLARANEDDPGGALARLLGSAPSGLSFHAAEVRLLPQTSAWRARQSTRLPLFTWTVRTPEERAAAARWADAPIFEGYEP